MILWTPQPLEQVFADPPKDDNSPSLLLEMEYKGRKVLVEKLDFDKKRIVQLISSDPQDYLLAEFQPGTTINFS